MATQRPEVSAAEMDVLKALWDQGPATVRELSTHLFSPRAQGPMADSETYAHLEHLRLAGHAKVTSVDGRLEYVVD